MRERYKNRNKAGRNRIHNIIAGKVLDLVYPPRCPICDKILSGGEDGCCGKCKEKLPWISGPACMKCGKAVETTAQEYCDDCRRQEHYFDRGVAAFTYNKELRHSVYRMKAENRRDYLDFYAEAMACAVSKYLVSWRPEVIIPVPMHPKKRRKRGYNQSELLAEKISAITGIPVRRGLFQCVKLTASQKNLDRKERMKNLRDSFAVIEPFPDITRVLVVDDIYTTGSTMDEISRVLKMRGVECVFFVVLCAGNGKRRYA